MSARSMGMLVVGVGACIVLLGLLMMSGGLSWFGHLPGDVRYESGRVRLYVPITSMLLISAALSLLTYLLRRFF